MVNKSLSVLTGGLFFVVATLLSVVFAAWWIAPFVVSSLWLGCLLIGDAVNGARPELPSFASHSPSASNEPSAESEAGSRLAA